MRGLVLLISIFFLSINIYPEPAYSQTKIVVAASESGRDHPMYSISCRLLQEAYTMIGCDMELKIVPAMRAIAMFDRAEVDSYIFSDSGFTEKHAGSVMVKIPLGYDEFVVFTTTVDFKPDGWESLKPYSIGYLLGMIAVEKKIKGMKIDGAKDRDEIFKKLTAGRTDIAILPRFISPRLLNKYPGIRILLPPIERVKLYTFLNSKHADLAPGLARALSALEANGRIRAVTDQVMADIYK